MFLFCAKATLQKHMFLFQEFHQTNKINVLIVILRLRKNSTNLTDGENDDKKNNNDNPASV